MSREQLHDISHWESGWRGLTNTSAECQAALLTMLRSSYFIGIEKYIEKKYGSLKGLKTIELGCGRGVASAAMASKGASVTLVDLSQSALRSAEEFFRINHLPTPELILADAFDLPRNFIERFDVACSFGLAEHFKGKERLGIFEAHLSTLHSDGCAAISVPNRLYLPGQIYKFTAERLGTWPYGYEVDFTPRELLRYGQLAGLNECTIIGSEVLYDIYRHTFFKLIPFLNKIFRSRKPSPVTAKYVGSNNDTYTMTTNIKNSIRISPLDSTFGFTLVLLGLKKGPVSDQSI